MVLGAGFFFCTSSRISGGAARPRLVSNVSVFSRKRTFRSPQVFESNENWGFGRDCWVSAGLFVRALLASGSEHSNGIFVWERPRSALRVAFQISSAFHFSFFVSKFPNFQTSKLSLRLDVLRKFRVAFRILRIWNAAFPIPRFWNAAFRGLSVSTLSDFRERWSRSRSPPSHRSRHFLFDLLARWL